MNYADFILSINGSQGSYTVEARGPGQITLAPEPCRLEITPAVQEELNRIAYGEAPSRQRMQQIGEMLFNALFTRRISKAFGRSYDELPEDTHLRLKLVVRPPELNVLPWELLYDSDEGYFMAALLTFPLVRFIESSAPVATLAASLPLRLLYVQSVPADRPPLNLEASEQNIRLALQKLGTDVEITTVRAAQPSDLRNMLRQDFHILHYDGHADFDEASGAGALTLQDKNGLSHNLGGELLASYLDGSRVRLVVLAACESAMDSPQKRFSGIAHQVMKSSSLPAVVAMQYSIDDQSAAAFNSGFYAALAEQFPVDAAVVDGRKAILERLQGDPFAAPDWATPVLFLRTESGDILKPASPAVPKPEPPSRPQVDLTGAQISGGVNIAGRDVIVSQDGPPIDGPAAGMSHTPRSELVTLIRQRVSQDKLEDALKLLQQIDDQAAILLQGQLKRLKNEFLLGTLPREDFSTGRARVASAILELLK